MNFKEEIPEKFLIHTDFSSDELKILQKNKCKFVGKFFYNGSFRYEQTTSFASIPGFSTNYYIVKYISRDYVTSLFETRFCLQGYSIRSKEDAYKFHNHKNAQWRGSKSDFQMYQCNNSYGSLTELFNSKEYLELTPEKIIETDFKLTKVIFPISYKQWPKDVSTFFNSTFYEFSFDVILEFTGDIEESLIKKIDSSNNNRFSTNEYRCYYMNTNYEMFEQQIIPKSSYDGNDVVIGRNENKIYYAPKKSLGNEEYYKNLFGNRIIKGEFFIKREKK